MKSKRGTTIIGSFMTMFVATIAVVVILFFLVIGNGVFKRVVQDEDSSAAFASVSDYMVDNEKLVLAKSLTREGSSLDDAVEAVWDG